MISGRVDLPEATWSFERTRNGEIRLWRWVPAARSYQRKRKIPDVLRRALAVLAEADRG